MLAALFLVTAGVPLEAQRGAGGGQRGAGPGPGGGPPSAEAAAPVDLTGYWVTVITEDWLWRMVTPPKGDYASLPINAEARRVADRWDPAQDGSCLAYGAPALMRMPTRLRIAWQDAATLRIESDAGQQTRLLHFTTQPPAGAPRSLQGVSIAAWETGGGGGRGARGGRGGAGGGPPRWAPLRVETSNLLPGWLRPNGVPYSEDTVMTEHFIRFADEETGDEWLTIVTRVDDPRYLTQTYFTSPNFRRELDGSKFNPTPCRE
jgi:hypothetical protein